MQDRPDAIPTSPPRDRGLAVDANSAGFGSFEAARASTTIGRYAGKNRLDILAIAGAAASQIEARRGPARGSHQPAASRAELDRVLSRSLDASHHGAEFDTSILFYLGLVRGAVRSFRWTGVELDDLRQIAALGILEAAARFNPCERERFTPYASYYMWRACTHYVPEHVTTMRVPPRHYWKAQRTMAARPGLVDDAGLEPLVTSSSQAAAPSEAPNEAADAPPEGAVVTPSRPNPLEGAPQVVCPPSSDPNSALPPREEETAKAPQRRRPRSRRIRRSPLSAARRALRTASLDAPEVLGWRFALNVPSEDPSALEGLIAAELLEELPRAFAALSRTQRTILRARFGLAGTEKTLVRLGRDRGCSRESIRLYAEAAIRQLQQSLLRWDDSRGP